MNGLTAFMALITVLIWLAAAEWTISGIENDPRLWVRWYQLPRGARILLVLFAWPVLVIAVLTVLSRDIDHG